MSRAVLLMGKGSLAVRVAGWFRSSGDYDLRGIIPVVPEPTWTESLIDWAQAHDVPYAASGGYDDAQAMLDADLGDHLVVSVFYDKILPESFIEACGRILNLHNGPLPRYRGVSPINWALKNQEQMHGFTIHEITPGIDDGPIVAQVQYSIYPEFEEVQDLYARALDFAYLLFEQTMPQLDRIEPRTQDESEATYYSAQDNERLGNRRGFTRAGSG